jgi:hypothetical protein
MQAADVTGQAAAWLKTQQKTMVDQGGHTSPVRAEKDAMVDQGGQTNPVLV